MNAYEMLMYIIRSLCRVDYIMYTTIYLISMDMFYFILCCRTSVPAIWIKGKFIGGFNDGPSEYNGLNTLNTKGELDAMLKYVPKTKHTSPR